MELLNRIRQGLDEAFFKPYEAPVDLESAWSDDDFTPECLREPYPAKKASSSSSLSVVSSLYSALSKVYRMVVPASVLVELPTPTPLGIPGDRHPVNLIDRCVEPMSEEEFDRLTPPGTFYKLESMRRDQVSMERSEWYQELSTVDFSA